MLTGEGDSGIFADMKARHPKQPQPLQFMRSCDEPEGRVANAARRDDALSALCAAVKVDFYSMYAGGWVGKWRSKMPFARIFYVLASGAAPGSLSDADSRIALLPNTWAFLPPGREIVHDQPAGINLVSVHFRVAMSGRPNPFLGRPMRGGGAPEFRTAFLGAAAGFGDQSEPGRIPASFLVRGAVWTLLGRVAEAEGEMLARNMERGAEFARLFEAVDAEPERNFSIGEMAKTVFQGESSFRRRFNAAMGVPPGAWFDTRRARAAAEALLESGATVAGVAERFGFGSEFYFSRFFKRHFGAAPSVWRRQFPV